MIISYLWPGVTQEDSGNYTCEVRGPHSVIHGQVTHFVLVRGKNISPSHYLVLKSGRLLTHSDRALSLHVSIRMIK